MSYGVPTVRLLDGAKRELRAYDPRERDEHDEDAKQAERLAKLDRAREQAGHEVYGGSDA